MYKTSRELSSGAQERDESKQLAEVIALSNGYNGMRMFSRHQHHLGTFTSDKVVFCMPFISDEVSRSIRDCLRRANLDNYVTLVESPPDNLRKRLVRNRMYDRVCTTTQCVICPSGKPGDCMIVGSIYCIECTGCGEQYIGETGRKLYIRLKEHIRGRDKSLQGTALGNHRIMSHQGAHFDIRVTVLGVESDVSARKLLEACWIRAKSPTMNRKDECISITTHLVPFLGKCNFWVCFIYFRSTVSLGCLTISPTTSVDKVCQSSVRFELVMLSMHYLEYFWVEFRRDCIDFVVNSWLMPFSGSEDGEPAETSALNKTSYHLVFGLTRKPTIHYTNAEVQRR